MASVTCDSVEKITVPILRDLGLLAVKISWEDVFKSKILAGTFKGVDNNCIPAFGE